MDPLEARLDTMAHCRTPNGSTWVQYRMIAASPLRLSKSCNRFQYEPVELATRVASDADSGRLPRQPDSRSVARTFSSAQRAPGTETRIPRASSDESGRSWQFEPGPCSARSFRHSLPGSRWIGFIRVNGAGVDSSTGEQVVTLPYRPGAFAPLLGCRSIRPSM